jgi:hypothetical protein
LSKKGIHKTDDLITKAECQFPPDLIGDIPDQVQTDIREAGKCLAYEVTTAGSFHLWRAVEGMMGACYCVLTNKTFDEAGVLRKCGKQIEALEKAGATNEVTVFLNHIRSQYRNPQNHPEANDSLNESLALFGAAASSISQQAIAIKEKKPDLVPIGSALLAVDSGAFESLQT